MPDKLIVATAAIDMSGLNKAMKLALDWSKRTPAEACNRAGLEVAVGAKNNMPYVTQDIVDTELDVITTPKIGKRGKPLKRGKQFSGNPTGFGGVPFPALIVQARVNPGSEYNQRTNQRYLLPQSPFKGVSRAQGAAKMAALIHSMIANRHKSGSFLKAGWVEAVKTMLLAAGRIKLFSGSPSEGASKLYKGGLGSATPATVGEHATCTLENDVGMEGKNEASFNHALMTYGLPGLQSAVDREGRKQMDYYLKKSGKEDLETPFNRLAG